MNAQHLSVFAFGEGLNPNLVLSASRDGSDLAAKTGGYYIKTALYLKDPLRTVLAAERQDEGFLLQFVKPRELDVNPEWRDFYAREHLEARITIVARAPSEWLSINFYREVGAAPLREGALAEMRELAPLIHTATSRHLALTRPQETVRDSAELLKERLSLLDIRLTPREEQVCVGALQGLTNSEIGKTLGIETTTVNTLRHRAYDRLGISSLAELFLLCLTVRSGR